MCKAVLITKKCCYRISIHGLLGKNTVPQVNVVLSPDCAIYYLNDSGLLDS